MKYSREIVLGFPLDVKALSLKVSLDTNNKPALASEKPFVRKGRAAFDEQTLKPFLTRSGGTHL